MDTVWRFIFDEKYGPQVVEGAKWNQRGTYLRIHVGRDSLRDIQKEHGVEVKSRREGEQARENEVSFIT